MVAAIALTGLTRRYALRQLVDVPNDRSSHRIPTPRGGGLAIVLAFFAACTGLALSGAMSAGVLLMLVSGLLVAGVGFWDDHGHVAARKRLLTHVLAGVLAIGVLGGFPTVIIGTWHVSLSWIGSVLALFWLIWLLNLFNFMDGIDGIAALEVVFVSFAALLLMYMTHETVGGIVIPLGALGAATAGFLVWNWPPAKIFMGDVGSGFVGYTLALIALADMRMPDGGLGLPVWVILNGLFLVDASYTLGRRITTGQQWYRPHRSHAYQKAAVMFGGHRPVIIYCLLINILWLFPCALAARVSPGLAIPMLAVALLPLLAIAIRLKAGDP